MHRYPSPFLLADAATTTATRAADADDSTWPLILGLVGSLTAVGVTVLLGVIRPSRLGVGRRIPADGPVMPLVGVLFAALVVWLAVPSLFVKPQAGAGRSETVPATKPAVPPAVPAAEGLSTRQLVVLNTTIPVVAFLVLVVGDALVRPQVGQRLGTERQRIPGGVLAALAGLALSLPLVYAGMALAEWAFRKIGYQHPNEHELLRAMGDTPDAWVKYLAILAAVLVAPLWEELLFRGHIQTLVRESLIRAGEGSLEPSSFDPAAAPRPHPLQSWLAVLLTSFVFASVHPVWTMPSIFVLSVCLGLAYERTNNLWVPTVMHAGFNSLMTAFFLLH